MLQISSYIRMYKKDCCSLCDYKKKVTNMKTEIQNYKLRELVMVVMSIYGGH